MVLLKEILYLLQKEIKLEWRQKYAIGGIFLYVASTIFVVYMGFIKIQPKEWNVLFWIIALFASINAVVKSFTQESGYRQLYFYQIANPTAILLSKIIYNTLLLLLLNLLIWLLLGFVMGSPVRDDQAFFFGLLLASSGLAITLTFISAIASKASNSSTLMAILSFPVIIPVLLTLVKYSAGAIGLITDTAGWKDVGILLAIDAILLSLSFVLFPYLWRD
ncbi:MAG: heme exporter protein CcmB [Saprospiraceae bacterium]